MVYDVAINDSIWCHLQYEQYRDNIRSLYECTTLAYTMKNENQENALQCLHTQITIKIFFIETQAVLSGGFCAISVKSTGLLNFESFFEFFSASLSSSISF